MNSHLTIQALNDTEAMLSWTDGAPPFQVERRNSLTASEPWTDFGLPTMARTMRVNTTGTQGYFRLREAIVMLLDADFPDANTTRLFWTMPDF